MKNNNALIQPVGLIGLGLMGRGIASCLLSHGLEVIAYNRTAARARASIGHIQTALDELTRRRIVPRAGVKNWRDRFRLVRSLEELAPARFVIDIAYWATIAGPFCWMDLTGIPSDAAVMEGLFPTLCNLRKELKMMRDM